MLIQHSGRAPRLEMVSFKKLNKGTLALGVVFKVGVFFMSVSQGHTTSLFREDSLFCYPQVILPAVSDDDFDSFVGT